VSTTSCFSPRNYKKMLIKELAKRLLLAVIACLCVVPALQAATDVSGAITANTTWTQALSPYQVSGDISIVSGAALSIEPGVTVYFNSGTNLIVTSGALIARGNAALPIIFTSALDIVGSTPAPGDWGQLRFMDGSNDATTILEYAQIRFGQGISIQSASPTFNNLQITNNNGAAVAIDLNSSPQGSGNQASGNTLNGVSVPAGDLTGSVTWGLKGIPYVVASGIVSVGKSPTITSISPAEVQQGLSVDSIIYGTRLSGADAIKFDSSGLGATLSSGAGDTSVPLKISAGASQPLGFVAFDLKTAAGWVRYANGINVIPLKPTIVVSSIAPSSMRRAETKSFQISGNYLQGAQVNPTSGMGLTVSNLLTTNTSASFDLTSSSLAALGAQPLAVTNPAIANGTAAMLVTIVDALPRIDINSIPPAVVPDSIVRPFALSLTNADTIDHTLNFSVADSTIISVSPSSLTIPAGTTTGLIYLAGLKPGYTLFNITSPTLSAVSKQIYASSLLNGAEVGPVLSYPVGLTVPYSLSSLPIGTVLPVTSAVVGVDVPYNPATLLPIGTVVPVASLVVGVDVPYNPATLLPIGTIVPVASAAVGVDVPYSLSAQPVGTVIGPILSPPVGVTVP
jgi:hypothetical protein